MSILKNPELLLAIVYRDVKHRPFIQHLIAINDAINAIVSGSGKPTNYDTFETVNTRHCSRYVA